MRLPATALERLLRRELAAVLVKPLAEPLPQRREVTRLDLIVEVRKIPPQGLPDLHRHDVAEGVGGEVAEDAARPVDVLEHPVGVVRHLDAEVLVHARVPLLREVGERDPAREQLLLELEAEDHVEVVRDLVRLDADERGLHLVDRPVEALGVGRPEHLGERVPQHRRRTGARTAGCGRRGSPRAGSATRGARGRRRHRAACGRARAPSRARRGRGRTRGSRRTAPMRASSTYRVVIRMSVRPEPDANGWTVGSSRHDDSSKPSGVRMATTAARCRSIGNGPCASAPSTASAESRTAAISGTSSSLSRSNTCRTSAVVISGSKSSSSTS